MSRLVRWLPLAALLAMTAAWGSTFFLLKDLVTRLPVADLLALRFVIASLALVLAAGRRLRWDSDIARRGLLLGGLYGVAQLLQTAGLTTTAASVSGFLTGLYVVATPLLAAAILRTRVSGWIWAGAVLATVGLGVLSLRGFAIGYGELLTVISAIVYAAHILALGRLSGPTTALSLAVVQTATVAAICTLAALVDGRLVLPTTGPDWARVLYLAVVAGALTMFLQTWAQARMDASRAAVIMAMEPVWAAGFAVALGGETLTVRLLLGGAAIVAAMFLVEVVPRWASSRSRPASVASEPPRRRAG